MNSVGSDRLQHQGSGKPAIRSMPIDLWSVADRTAWEAACRPAVRLQRGGSASHLKLVTRNDLAKRYGLFLDFLARSGRLHAVSEPAGLVTRQHVDPYL